MKQEIKGSWTQLNEHQYVAPSFFCNGVDWDNLPKREKNLLKDALNKKRGETSYLKAFEKAFGESFDYRKVDWEKMNVFLDTTNELEYHCYNNRCFFMGFSKKIVPDSCWDRYFFIVPDAPLYLYNKKDHIEFKGQDGR